MKSKIEIIEELFKKFLFLENEIGQLLFSFRKDLQYLKSHLEKEKEETLQRSERFLKIN